MEENKSTVDLESFFHFDFQNGAHFELLIEAQDRVPSDVDWFEVGKALAFFLQSYPLLISIQFMIFYFEDSFWQPVFSYLSSNHNLHTLKFSVIRVNDTMVQSWVNLITYNKGLKRIYSDYNFVTDSLSHIEMIVSAFAQNNTLEKIAAPLIYLDRFEFWETYYSQSRTGISSVKKISFFGSSSQPRVPHYINEPVCQNLKSLDLSSVFRTNDPHQNHVFYETLMLLSRNTTLTKLDISSNQYHISLTQLENLGEVGAKLARHPSLTDLRMSFLQISDTFNNNFVTNLRDNTSLVSLNLNNMYLDSIQCARLLNSLSLHTTITSLNLLGNDMFDELPDRIALMIKHNSTLQTLRISAMVANHREFFQDVGDALSVNTSLKTLQLIQMAATPVRSLSQPWARLNHTLEELDLSCNTILNNDNLNNHIVDFSWLRDFLTENRTLKKLNITNCQITEAMMEIIIDGLVANQTLQKINLSHNFVTGKHINRILRHNQHLRSLYLQKSRSFLKFAPILKGLKENHALRTLRIYDSTNDGIYLLHLLGEVLLVNTTIVKLYLPIDQINLAFSDFFF